MALSPGTRFGPYEIVGEIGAGGMGVVYRATDTTLDRDVAIKVLPESMASDAERIARFDREAKTLASLNHPNIAQIYGLERSDGTTALVMELVEGPTLADRIEKGALPADEALGIAMQIAEALEAAHGQGIIHRDLKPANIKLRPDGTVKVLDFGIAKALEPENLTSGPQSPMMTTPATMAGVILGTAAYMSPEQAKGKPVDQRTDIWAFGVLLYEMLTGQLAFGAEDVPTTLARVIANETNLDSLPVAISPAVRQTIKLCLQKDVRTRLQSIGDARLALEGAFETESTQVAEAAAAKPVLRRALPLAAAVLLGGIIVGGTAWRYWPVLDPPIVSRFAISQSVTRPVFVNRFNHSVTLSPDGKNVVYQVFNDGQPELVVRPLNALEATPLHGTVEDLFFSPDSAWLGFMDGAGLKRIPVTGGPALAITSYEGFARGAVWGGDDTVIFGTSQPSGLWQVPAGGGTPEEVTTLDEPDGQTNHHWPDLLPGGEAILFTIETIGEEPETAQIALRHLGTGEQRVLLVGGSDARYVSTGHVIYGFEGTLRAVPFDLNRLEVTGNPVPVLDGVVTTEIGAANFSVAQNGTLAYMTGSPRIPLRSLVWVDSEGREEPIDAPPRVYTSPRISPDGTKVALNARDQEQDIWVWDLARETFTRLTFDPGLDRFPVWSPDSQRIAYSSQRDGGGDRFMTALDWQTADGTGAPARLAESPGQIFPHSFLPDGSGVLAQGDPTGNQNDDIVIYQTEGEEGATALLETSFGERTPELSPDGRWLAYESDESGRSEIYVRPFPDINSGRWQVSTDGGVHPLWARDGGQLFYRNSDALMAVPVEANPSFAAGDPEILFEDQYFGTGEGGRSYDISPVDGRFLMIKAVEDTSQTPQIIVVQNWVEELMRLVPPE